MRRFLFLLALPFLLLPAGCGDRRTVGDAPGIENTTVKEGGFGPKGGTPGGPFKRLPR